METWILFLVKAFSSGTPILYGTLGEIVNEKSGHLNLGVQGMMAVGGCAGFLTGYYSNNLFLALFAAFLGGVLTSLIYAFLTVTLMANQNVTGLTLTIFGVGLANFIGKFALNRTPTGTLKLPDGIAGQLKDIRFPFLEKIPGVGPWLYTLSPSTFSSTSRWPSPLCWRCTSITPKPDGICGLSGKTPPPRTRQASMSPG